MKYLSFILSALIFMSCNQSSNKNEKQNSNDLDKISGKELIENGFLDYSDSLRVDSLKNEIIESFNIYSENNNRFVHIDAEELSEFNFDFFMPQLNRILSKRDLRLEIETAIDYDSSNDILINGQKLKLYTNSELEAGTFWDSAPSNFFKKVNEILKGQNIKERFYLLYGGNDLHTFLLTENQFKIISERYKNENNEIPYLP
ncbi:hypothetical protein GCQ56_20150 [Marinifilum sp. N1E240]|uniref:hypothetical protein n=1 Tax=Marinifilum sp. N1E240 TaxID=2608082 RepID=UPI00128C10B3|nr:hypothetical protein [Marinifilum sp. N1E240]MPQ49312.1 hypothetical protein [Marinifilum sp. N1E240]